MNKRKILGLILIFLILGCFTIWWKNQRPPVRSEGDVAPHSNQSQSGLAKNPDPLEGNPSYLDRVKMFVAANQYFDLPCRGKVVDENGAPVAGATIIYGVSRGYENPTRGRTTVDDQGNFSVEGQRGGSLSLHAEHPDYISTDASRTVIESLDSPIAHHERTDQATLVLRKKLPEQPVIERRNRLFFNCGIGSGVEYYDLKSRTLVAAESSTTLRIRTEVSPTRDQTPGRYDWSLTVDVPGGSVLIKTDPYLFEAPADGHEDSFNMVAQARSSDWKVVGKLSFFVKLKTDEFGMVDLDFDSRDGSGRIFSSSLNPEPGNRNLTPQSDR